MMCAADSNLLEEFPPSVWRQQAVQFPQNSTPCSIEHLQTTEFQALLYYDDKGCLRGILKYFERDILKNDQHGDYLVAHAGDVLIMVDPNYQERGIGSALLRKAMNIYSVDLGKQTYTPSGAAFVARFQEKRRSK